MPFCAQCHERPARCLRQCRREADGRHLWAVMREEMQRGRPPIAHEPAFDRLPEDVRRAYIAGAEAMRQMPR